MHVFGQNRFFDKHRLQCIECMQQGLCGGPVNPAVEVEGNIEAASNSFFCFGKDTHNPVNFSMGFDKIHLGAGIHFHSGVALPLALQ